MTVGRIAVITLFSGLLAVVVLAPAGRDVLMRPSRGLSAEALRTTLERAGVLQLLNAR